VSGTLSAPSFNATDSDVNDPLASYAPNDTAAQAQPLPNPATVGGFVTALATGVTGDRFQSAADVDDFYVVTLAGGEVITLSISDHPGGNSTTPDLDLGLRDSASQTLIDVSSGEGPAESVTTLTAGTYLVQVQAYTGKSNYTLSIGQPISPATAPLDTNAEFVPGDIIVRFKETIKTVSGENSLNARAASVGLKPLSGNAGRSMLMRHEGGVQRAQALRMLGISDKNKDGTLARLVASKQDAHRLDTIRAVQALRARADVAEADLNYIHRPFLTPNDVMYSRQWHYPLIRLPQAWDITTGTPATGQVIVAVIDTGVVLSHSDLAGQLIQGYDFISNPTNAKDGDGIDPNADDPGDGLIPGSSSFHGTHVAGTVAASTNNSTGVAGVSWGARIMPLRVLGALGGTSYDVIQAVRYAARLPNDSGTLPAQRADIINLSLGGGAFSQSEQSEYTAARNQGVIIIAAAGNENTSQLSYPASYDGVVSVGAVGLNSAKAPYSNIGAALDVVAPGGDASADLNGDGFPDGILSTLAIDASGAIVTTYQYNHGTSMAAPHMAGVAALMKAVYPDLIPSELDLELASGEITQDLGDPGRDDIFGHGLIDALKAVQRAQALAGGAPSLPLLTVTPTALNYGFTMRTPQTLTATNGGGGTLSNVNAADNAAWLTVAGSGLGPYTVSVNDSGLGAGVYSAKIAFTSSANTVTIPVNMQVGSAGTGNAGFHYILLIDPATGDASHQGTTSATGGKYSYSIGSVTAGSYYVVAGSDLDNDGFICDPGEACGAYPTIDLPTILNASTPNLTGIDFATGFAPAIGAQSTQVQSQSGYRRTSTKQVAH
jgi:serine protease